MTTINAVTETLNWCKLTDKGSGDTERRVGGTSNGSD